MWDMFSNSFRLFLKGKLFRSPREVLRQWSIGFVVALVVVVVLGELGLAVWIAVGLAAFVSGVIQPWLFRNLKYN